MTRRIPTLTTSQLSLAEMCNYHAAMARALYIDKWMYYHEFMHSLSLNDTAWAYKMYQSFLYIMRECEIHSRLAIKYRLEYIANQRS